MLSSHLSRCLAFAAAAILAGSCAAQVMQDPGTMPDGQRMQVPGDTPGRRHARLMHLPDGAQRPMMPPGQTHPPQVTTGSTAHASATPPPAPAVVVQRPALPSLLDKPPQPATVTLSSGQLAVKADNSSLSQILSQLASSSGMTINGLNKDQRVFGSYGPGSPQQVLSSLLDGAGYNVMMLGVSREGAPRQLILTARSNAPATPSQQQQASSEDDQPPPDEDDSQSNDNPPVNFPERINPVMPHMNPDSQQGAGVKTPQQILQELQQLRQQQQQAPQ
jgi:hypothetical protein